MTNYIYLFFSSSFSSSLNRIWFRKIFIIKRLHDNRGQEVDYEDLLSEPDITRAAPGADVDKVAEAAHHNSRDTNYEDYVIIHPCFWYFL